MVQAGAFPPAHLYRSPDGAGEGQIGPFQSDPGDPNADPPIPPVEAADTPGTENSGGGVIPIETLEIRSFSVDVEDGRVVINATGLGTKIWTVETSLDFGQNDPWVEVDRVIESDPNDGSGSTDFNFTFTSGAEETARFFRLVEVN